MSDDEKRVLVNAEVPESVRDTAKDKLEYGGISREIRDRLQEIAYGQDLNQRSRLERRREEIKENRREKRKERREIEGEIEDLEEQLQGVDEKLASLTSREEKYEAKLEELEDQLRSDGMRIFPDLGGVQRAASTGETEPEGVIKQLKERNPDIPAFAFESGINDYENDWNGVSESDAGKDVDERERRFR